MPSPASRMRHKTAQVEAAKANEGKVAVVDATGAIAGRLATALAKRLLGGETVIVLNSEKAIVSGKGYSIKERYKFKVDVGTRRKGPFPSRMPHLMLKRTVRGMLPRDRPNGRAALGRLTCHIGVPPEFVGKPTEQVKEAVKVMEQSMTLLEISQYLGKDVKVNHPGA